MYYAEEEIFNQFKSLRLTFDYMMEQQQRIRQFWAAYPPTEIVFIGCGSSYWGALSAQHTMQMATGVQCHAVTSGDVLLNKGFYRSVYAKPLFIAPSRSGSTSETVEALAFLKDVYSTPVLGIVEYEDSPLEHLSDFILKLPWCTEQGVCQTRSFSCLYLTSIMIASFVGHDHELLEELRRYVETAEQICDRTRPEIEQLVQSHGAWSQAVSLGSGVAHGVACEGALILIEMAQVPSTYYYTLDVRHGPTVNLDDNCMVFLFAGSSDTRRLEENLTADLRKKNVHVTVFCDIAPFANGNSVFELGYPTRPEIIALFGIYVMQAIACYKALQKGVNPDHPAGLSPWIELQQLQP